MRSTDLRVLFRAPAGPRRGFGHLLRCRALARALGVPPVVALRAAGSTRLAAARLGITVVSGEPSRLLRATRPDVVVIDDLVASQGARWIRSARRLGIPVVGIHDLGRGCLDADLVVDASVITCVSIAPRRARTGLPYAVLDPAFARLERRRTRDVPVVLIALGGGPRRRLAFAMAQAIVRRVPGVCVRIAGGLAPRGTMRLAAPGIAWTGPLDGLHHEFTRCDVAVVAGGISLYEACASGVPAVALPVVADQVPTVRGFGARGGCLALALGAPPSTLAAHVARLLGDRTSRTRLGRSGRTLVDGRGALRIAAAIRQLLAAKAAAESAA